MCAAPPFLDEGNLTVTAVAAKVIATALKAFPQFNASVDLAAQTALDALVPGLSEATRATIARGPDAAGRLTLTLGSPEFQRR